MLLVYNLVIVNFYFTNESLVIVLLKNKRRFKLDKMRKHKGGEVCNFKMSYRIPNLPPPPYHVLPHFKVLGQKKNQPGVEQIYAHSIHNAVKIFLKLV